MMMGVGVQVRSISRHVRSQDSVRLPAVAPSTQNDSIGLTRSSAVNSVFNGSALCPVNAVLFNESIEIHAANFV